MQPTGDEEKEEADGAATAAGDDDDEEMEEIAVGEWVEDGKQSLPLIG